MTAEESTSINNQYNNDSNFNEDEMVPKFKPAPITQQPKQNTQMKSYAREFPIPKNEHTGYGSFINCLGSCLGFCGAIPCCPMPTPYKEVKQGEVGLLSRFGAFYKSVDPGLVKINLCSEDLRRVSVRTKSANIRDQVAITKDNVSVRIDSVIYYQVCSISFIIKLCLSVPCRLKIHIKQFTQLKISKDLWLSVLKSPWEMLLVVPIYKMLFKIG